MERNVQHTRNFPLVSTYTSTGYPPSITWCLSTLQLTTQLSLQLISPLLINLPILEVLLEEIMFYETAVSLFRYWLTQKRQIWFIKNESRIIRLFIVVEITWRTDIAIIFYIISEGIFRQFVTKASIFAMNRKSWNKLKVF